MTRTSRARRFAFAILTASAGFATSCGQEEEPAEPINVVLISIDTLRPDHLGTYGYERITSPRIDAIAKTGVVFENAFSQSPKTGPSHMTMMTGLFPETHGVRNLGDEPNLRLSDSIPVLAELLKKANYQTAAFTGGAHVGKELGFDRGFDVFEVGGGVQGIFQKAIDQAEQMSKRPDPFFLFVHTFEVHDPYVPPVKYQEWNDPSYQGDIFSSRRELKTAAGDQWQKQHELFWSKVDPERPGDIQRLQDLYDGSIKLTDELVGLLSDRLAAFGELDNTLFIIVSDHGEEFYEHEGFLHEALFNEVLRVVFVAKLPKDRSTQSAQRIAQPVRLVDLTPTVLRFLDLPTPELQQGVDLLPLLRGESTDELRPIYAQWPRSFMYSLETGGWKLIQKEHEEGVDEMLFEMSNDPGEKSSLLEAKPEPATRLRERLTEIREVSKKLNSLFGTGAEAPMSEELRKQLESLGYIGKKK